MFTDEQMLALIPSLTSQAIRLTKRRAQADDLVQATLERMLQNRNNYKAGNLRAWAYILMLNHFRGEYRHMSKMTMLSDEVLRELHAVDDPYEVLRAKQSMQIIADNLSAKHLDVLLLVANDGLTYEEAAAKVKVSVGTVKSRVHRAREHAKDSLCQTEYGH